MAKACFSVAFSGSGSLVFIASGGYGIGSLLKITLTVFGSTAPWRTALSNESNDSAAASTCPCTSAARLLAWLPVNCSAARSLAGSMPSLIIEATWNVKLEAELTSPNAARRPFRSASELIGESALANMAA
ncbi:hypothetical protein D9M69_566230 [compost metagenome]